MYLYKIDEQLKELRKAYNSLKDENLDGVDDITSFTKILNQKTTRDILQSKISTFETMKLLMKQELLTVHRSIINHFITINALQTSKSTILPLIASEMAINIGNRSEGEALELTNNLLGLFQSVVNKNEVLAQQNLQRLKVSSISEEDFNALNLRVNAYLADISKEGRMLQGSNNQLRLEQSKSPFDVRTREAEEES